jgi:hypothetical protein
MPKNRAMMSLSPEEEHFLRHWMYDEMHYREGIGPAKRLQVEHRVAPADLAAIIAAAIPYPAEQEAAASSRPADPPIWPWTADRLAARLAEARALTPPPPPLTSAAGRVG